MIGVPDDKPLAIWSDDPAETDLLSFDAIAATVADVLLDPTIDPVALGLSGSWGSGKTTVLRLVENELTERGTNEAKVLVVNADPWRYDPATGAKESLIAEVLSALADELAEHPAHDEAAKTKAVALIKRLAKRVDWAKAIKLTAKTSLAFQLPSIDDLFGLVKEPEKAGEPAEIKGLDAFRDEFAELMASEPLAHVRSVAVLVDDLDRCLPETVIESLEAIRLFLAVPKMSFVIAADEARVADAIRTRFRVTGEEAPRGGDGESEEPAKLYLHKIVQTTIPLPGLSRFDTQSFLVLLQLQQRLAVQQLEQIIATCAELRRSAGSLDELQVDGDLDVSEEIAFASRLTPLLYEKLQGNPRRIKRFLNDLRVRRSIAARRGIDLDFAIVAKLMVLEKLLESEFKALLEWLAKGTLRDQLEALEQAAGKGAVEQPSDSAPDRSGSTPKRRSATDEAPVPQTFQESMLRWAKLPPVLSGVDLSPYLLLAATFTGTPLVDESLPESLRDIAANLMSSARSDQRAVTNSDLTTLSAADGQALLMHIGRTLRDQPTKQKTGITAILRTARLRDDLIEVAAKALSMLPVDDVSAPSGLLFSPSDPPKIKAVATQWQEATTDGGLRESIKVGLSNEGTS